MKLWVGSRSDVGRVRTRNEDKIYVEPTDSDDARSHGWLGVVADGVGGRLAGDVASRLAVETTRAGFYGQDPGTPADRLRAAVVNANTTIYRAAQQTPEESRMASTITAAAVRDGSLFIAQVGDTRAYLVRDGQIRRVTRDHSLVAELVRSGELTAEQARVHPARNQVTRALGADEQVEVDLVETTLEPGDILVLCSDGLHGLVEDREIAAAAVADNPQLAADSLVALANERGGTDNISVVVVKAQPSTVPPPPPPLIERVPAARRPAWVVPGLIGLVALVVIAGVALGAGLFRAPASTPPLAVQATQPAPTAAPSATPAPQPTPVVVVPPTPVPQPTPVPVAPPPPPAPQPTPLVVARPTATAVLRQFARLRADRTTYIRDGPQPTARLIDSPPAEEPDGIRVEVLSRLPGPTPEDPSLLPDEQRPIWYRIIWPPDSDSQGFVHCSSIALEAATGSSCAAP